MTNKIEEKKKKIDEQIEKNMLRKKMLLAKEKKKRASKFSDIGRLAYQANIDEIDNQTLFGAFLEIAKNANKEKMFEWKKEAEDFTNNRKKNSECVFSISFIEEPNNEVRKKLKENKFSWNRFRKEYYGKGHKSEIESLLIDCKYNLEEIIS